MVFVFKFIKIMKNIFKKNKNQQGLTLIETITVVSILVILSSIIFGNYKTGSDALALDRASQKLAQDLRRASEMSLAGTGGYQAVGVYLSTSSATQYIIFGEQNNTHVRDTATPPDQNDTDIETINIESGIKICGIYLGSTATSPMSIEFEAPMPNVYLASDAGTTDDAKIVLAPTSETNCSSPTKSKTVKINKVGRIDITN